MTTRKEYLKRKRQRSRTVMKSGTRRFFWIPLIIILLAVLAAAAFFLYRYVQKSRPDPEDTVKKYFSLLSAKEYKKMYGLLDDSSQESISENDFITRNQNIYEGIDAADLKISFPKDAKNSHRQSETVTYHTKMETSAGTLSFDNQINLNRGKDKTYRIHWDSSVIFPELKEEYKVQVQTSPARRGNIYDRNGNALATWGTVSEVGLVPGKMNPDNASDLQKIGELLDMSTDSIQTLLSASWVQDDSFVPLKRIPKDDSATSQQLLSIPGILINDAEERVYPLGAAAGPLTGYVQSITAEELEKKEGQGYSAGSTIGKSGLELAYESKLHPVNGSTISIVDQDGTQIDLLASRDPINGQDIYVTIDSSLQQSAYEQFISDPGTAVAMNPKNGEVLALVSTPAYDPNEFTMGISNTRWDELNHDPDRPLSSRFLDAWVPGSTFKAITGAVAIDSGTVDPNANLGNTGLRWQKDSSWGDYYITTLTGYGDMVNMENAFIYSDNIYFARIALETGAQTLTDKLKEMGFGEKIPFELGLTSSSYDSDGNIDSDIQLADTGYGQGQLLVNPVHMLSLYSMFVNQGSMITPVLTFSQDNPGQIWKEQVISSGTAETIRNDLIQVIENPDGTGAGGRIDGLKLLGKTGTAEIKDTQDDTTGTERGWFICETAEDTEKPIVFAGMVEDVKNKGGSHYVVGKVRNAVAAYEGK